MAYIVYCSNCKKFELVDKVSGYNCSGNYTCTETNNNFYSSYVINLDTFKELDNNKTHYNRYKRHYLGFYEDIKDIFDKEDSYYNDFGDFRFSRYEKGRVLDKDLLLDIIFKYRIRTDKYLLKKINESIKIEEKVLNRYALVINIKEQLKKNKAVFYINGERQRGWIQNTQNHIINSWRNMDEYKEYFSKLDEEKFQRYPFVNDLGYFTDVLKNLIEEPYYEILIKAKIITYISSSLGRYVNRKGTTPVEILKINKNQLKILKDYLNKKYQIISYYYRAEVSGILSYLQESPKLTYEKFNKIYKTYEHFYNTSYTPSLDPGQLSTHEYFNVIKLIEEENYDVEKLFNYIIEDCRELQGIVKISDSLMYLSDYIEFSKDLELKYNKYPKSLRLEHDKLAYMKILKADEINNRKMKARVELLSKYEYEDKKLGFKMIIPKESMDLKREGTALNHCVGSYVDKFIRGDSNIFFIRRIEDPDKSLATVELDNCYRLVQSRGFCNRDLYKEEKEFLNKWLQFVEDINSKEAEQETA